MTIKTTCTIRHQRYAVTAGDGGQKLQIHPEHNERRENVTGFEAHIDPNGWYESWKKGVSLEEAYRQLFTDACNSYREQMREKKRPWRSLPTDGAEYLDRVLDNRSGGKSRVSGIKEGISPCYEMIVSVGRLAPDRDQDGHIVRDASGNPVRSGMVPHDLAHEILREYYDGFKERNPNIEVIQCDWHGDERDPETGVPGSGHIHVIYVPVVRNAKRGMKKHVSISGALKEQGFQGNGKSEDPRLQWNKAEAKALEAVCRSHGLDIFHPCAGKNAHHVETDLFKAKAKLMELNDEIEFKRRKLKEDPQKEIEKKHQEELARVKAEAEREHLIKVKQLEEDRAKFFTRYIAFRNERDEWEQKARDLERQLAEKEEAEEKRRRRIARQVKMAEMDMSGTRKPKGYGPSK